MSDNSPKLKALEELASAMKSLKLDRLKGFKKPAPIAAEAAMVCTRSEGCVSCSA